MSDPNEVFCGLTHHQSVSTQLAFSEHSTYTSIRTILCEPLSLPIGYQHLCTLHTLSNNKCHI